MKLADSLIFSAAVALFIIGVHQVMTVGLAHAYWIFMLSVILLLLYKYRKREKDPS